MTCDAKVADLEAEIIERFQVSRATIKRYVKQRRETGTVLPRPISGLPHASRRTNGFVLPLEKSFTTVSKM